MCAWKKNKNDTKEAQLWFTRILIINLSSIWIDCQSLMNDAQQKGLFMLADLQPRQQNYSIENGIQIAAGNREQCQQASSRKTALYCWSTGDCWIYILSNQVAHLCKMPGWIYTHTNSIMGTGESCATVYALLWYFFKKKQEKTNQIRFAEYLSSFYTPKCQNSGNLHVLPASTSW